MILSVLFLNKEAPTSAVNIPMKGKTKNITMMLSAMLETVENPDKVSSRGTNRAVTPIRNSRAIESLTRSTSMVLIPVVILIPSRLFK